MLWGNQVVTLANWIGYYVGGGDINSGVLCPHSHIARLWQDDVITCKRFPYCLLFLREIYQGTVDPHYKWTILRKLWFLCCQIEQADRQTLELSSLCPECLRYPLMAQQRMHGWICGIIMVVALSFLVAQMVVNMTPNPPRPYLTANIDASLNGEGHSMVLRKS